MNIKTFINKLDKIINKDQSFVLYSKYNDKCFSNLDDDEIAIVGEDNNSVFSIKIHKVKYDKKD